MAILKRWRCAIDVYIIFVCIDHTAMQWCKEKKIGHFHAVCKTIYCMMVKWTWSTWLPHTEAWTRHRLTPMWCVTWVHNCLLCNFKVNPEYLTALHDSDSLRPGTATDSHSCGTVTSVPQHLRQVEHMWPEGIQPYYTKYTQAYGIPIVGEWLYSKCMYGVFDTWYRWATMLYY